MFFVEKTIILSHDKSEPINIEIQLDSSENYQKLLNPICINLLDYNSLNHDKFYSVYRLKNVKRVEEVRTKLEAWLYFIN